MYLVSYCLFYLYILFYLFFFYFEYCTITIMLMHMFCFSSIYYLFIIQLHNIHIYIFSCLFHYPIKNKRTVFFISQLIRRPLLLSSYHKIGACINQTCYLKFMGQSLLDAFKFFLPENRKPTCSNETKLHEKNLYMHGQTRN